MTIIHLGDREVVHRPKEIPDAEYAYSHCYNCDYFRAVKMDGRTALCCTIARPCYMAKEEKNEHR